MIGVFKKKRQILVSYLFAPDGKLSFGQIRMSANRKMDDVVIEEAIERIKDNLGTDCDVIILNILKFE